MTIEFFESEMFVCHSAVGMTWRMKYGTEFTHVRLKENAKGFYSITVLPFLASKQPPEAGVLCSRTCLQPLGC